MAEQQEPVSEQLAAEEIEEIISSVDISDEAKLRIIEAIKFRLTARKILGNIPVTLDSTEELVARVRGHVLTSEEIRDEQVLFYHHLYSIAERGQTLFVGPLGYEPTDENLGKVIFPFDYDRAGGAE